MLDVVDSFNVNRLEFEVEGLRDCQCFGSNLQVMLNLWEKFCTHNFYCNYRHSTGNLINVIGGEI